MHKVKVQRKQYFMSTESASKMTIHVTHKVKSKITLDLK